MRSSTKKYTATELASRKADPKLEVLREVVSCYSTSSKNNQSEQSNSSQAEETHSKLI
jgi:hypothetical protein